MSFGTVSRHPIPRGPDGRILPGAPGRPKGARNLATRAVRTILEHFDDYSDESLDMLRRHHPKNFATLIGRLLPRQALIVARRMADLDEAEAQSLFRAVQHAMSQADDARAALMAAEALMQGEDAGDR